MAQISQPPLCEEKTPSICLKFFRVRRSLMGEQQPFRPGSRKSLHAVRLLGISNGYRSVWKGSWVSQSRSYMQRQLRRGTTKARKIKEKRFRAIVMNNSIAAFNNINKLNCIRIFLCILIFDIYSHQKHAKRLLMRVDLWSDVIRIHKEYITRIIIT